MTCEILLMLVHVHVLMKNKYWSHLTDQYIMAPKTLLLYTVSNKYTYTCTYIQLLKCLYATQGSHLGWKNGKGLVVDVHHSIVQQ